MEQQQILEGGSNIFQSLAQNLFIKLCCVFILIKMFVQVGPAWAGEPSV